MWEAVASRLLLCPGVRVRAVAFIFRGPGFLEGPTCPNSAVANDSFLEAGKPYGRGNMVEAPTVLPMR